MANTSGMTSSGKPAWWLSAGIQIPFIFSFLITVGVAVMNLGAFKEEFSARGERLAAVERKMDEILKEHNRLELITIQNTQNIAELTRLIERVELAIQRHIDYGGPR